MTHAGSDIRTSLLKCMFISTICSYFASTHQFLGFTENFLLIIIINNFFFALLLGKRKFTSGGEHSPEKETSGCYSPQIVCPTQTGGKLKKKMRLHENA